ncbi:MAG: hypothetical protein IJQ98_08530 [Oscillospiraceae bacterium]|nr:hypothetical protein [Oscillospiraceae bacterium]
MVDYQKLYYIMLTSKRRRTKRRSLEEVHHQIPNVKQHIALRRKDKALSRQSAKALFSFGEV